MNFEGGGGWGRERGRGREERGGREGSGDGGYCLFIVIIY